jgi:hypothetical protein
MWHLFVYGAVVVTAIFSRDTMILSAAFWLLIGAIAFNGKRDDINLSGKRPDAMLHLWIEQKARADAWSGMPWGEDKKGELSNEIQWHENYCQNWADEVESQRKQSFLWLVLNKLFRIKLRPVPFLSNSALYKIELMRQIKQAEFKKSSQAMD